MVLVIIAWWAQNTILLQQEVAYVSEIETRVE